MRNENVVVKKDCHSRGMLSGIYNACRYSKKGKILLNRCVEDPRLQISGMTPNLLGFTLIELLVVVLIIGILAAVAVPQYQKAVEKSKISTALPLLKMIGQAQEAYFLENSRYATLFEELSVTIPEQYNSQCTLSHATDCLTNGEWKIAITQEHFLEGTIYLFFKKDDIESGFYYMPTVGKNPQNASTYMKTLGLGCIERASNKRVRGDYCTALWNRHYITGGSAFSFFQ